MEIKDPKMWLAFEKYCEWLALPRYMAGYPNETLEARGYSDDLIELFKLKYKKDFAERFCVDHRQLSEWDKHPELQDRIKKNWKKWGKNLTPGVVGKFYEKLMSEADAPRMKVWMEHIEEENKSDNNTVNLNVGFENILKSMKEDGELHEKKEDKKTENEGIA